MNSNSFTIKDKKVRAFTFQDPELVYDIINEKEDYVYNGLHNREKRDYKLDIAQLGGKYPIWCFANKDKNFTLKEFIDNNLFTLFRSEMSLGTYGLSKFLMIEFMIDESKLKRGLTHNAYEHAHVFSELKYEDIVAVYSISYPDHWVYPKFVRVKELQVGSIFDSETDFHSIHLARKSNTYNKGQVAD